MPMRTIMGWGLLALLLLPVPPSFSASQTIGPGDDLGQAVSQMQPGDTLTLAGGTYHAANLSPPSGSTIQAAPGASPVITGSQDTLFDLSHAQGVTLDGLTLDGGRQVAFPIYAGPEAKDNTVENGAIINGRHSGMLVQGSGWTVANNDIKNNGTECCATHNDDHGMYFSASDSRITGNRFENPTACNNIQVYGGSNPSNNVIENNTFANSKCGVALTSGQNQTFRNNTLTNEGTANGKVGLYAVSGGSRIEGNKLEGTTMYTNGDVSVDGGGAGASGQPSPVSPTRTAQGQPSTQRSLTQIPGTLRVLDSP